jgi:hypothetical protein
MGKKTYFAGIDNNHLRGIRKKSSFYLSIISLTDIMPKVNYILNEKKNYRIGRMEEADVEVEDDCVDNLYI